MVMRLGAPCIVILAMLASPVAAGHPFSLSEAAVDIGKDVVRAEITVMLEDLYLYHDLEVSEEGYVSRPAIEEGIELHRPFLMRYFTLQDEGGAALQGEMVSVTPPEEIPEEGVHVGYLMASTVAYTIEYPVDAPPDYLSIMQSMGGEGAMLPATMQLTVTREGQPMGIRTTLIKDMPFTMRVDWDRPPYPIEGTAAEKEAWIEEENEATLGFTSYGAAYSFIYIDDFEVRHEILIPLLSLETWLALPRQDPDFIDVSEQEAARDLVAEFFAEHNTVEIDGVAVRPTLERLNFYGVDFKDFAQIAPRKRLPTFTARVGIILSHAAKSPPEHVRMEWDLFSMYVPALFSMVYAYEDIGQATFSQSKPEFEWTTPGRPPLPAITRVAPPPPPPQVGVPVVSLAAGVLALLMALAAVFRSPAKRLPYLGAMLMLCGIMAVFWYYRPVTMADPLHRPEPIANEDAEAVFETLLENVYRAFDYRIESDVYDALAKSVGGDLLTSLYVQIQKGLAMQEQGGAIARVRQVSVESAEAAAPQGRNPARAFEILGSWSVRGTVEHWGHIHARTNRYEARFLVEALADAWRITDIEVRNEERLKYETSLRVPKAAGE